MKENKGFSLIEVIIAIALLGIICVGMLTAMTSEFALMRKTRTMTEGLFEAQQLIEQKIDSVRQALNNGTTPDGTKTAFTLFSGSDQRTVFGYANTVEVNYGTGIMRLYAVAPDMKPLIFDVPSATDVAIEFNNGTTTLPYSYTSTPSMYVKSKFTKVDPKHVFLMGINKWYVSRPGFNIPNIVDPYKKFELEKGTVYPRFPEDYTLITGAIMKDLTTIKTTYAGRHLLYTITPAATSGKMGTTEISNAVFISGLPVTNNLKLHLDASMISVEDTDPSTGSLREVITTSGSDVITNYYVKQWTDISGNLDRWGNRFKALQATSGKQPELVQVKMGDILVSGKEYETYAKFIRFSGGQGLTVEDDNNLDIDNMTIFAVSRSTETTKEKTIVSKVRNTPNYMDTWYLGWDMGDVGTSAVDNRLAFYVRSNNNTRISTAVEAEGVGLDGNWHILTGTSQYNTDTLLSKTTLQIDKNTVVEDARPFSNSIVNNTPITIGFDGGTNYSTVDIAEIIIYDGVLSQAEIEAVQKYLTDKYQPSPPVVNIYSMPAITETVVIGESYSLPTKIPANMSNGTVRDVDVTWAPDTSTVDTSVGAVKVNTATAVSDSGKTTTLTLNVVGIQSMEDVALTLNKGTVYNLPSQVTAKLDNGISKLVDVTWDINTVDTSIIGDVTRIATADLDASKTMRLNITIVPIGVTSISLNKTTLVLDKNTSESLIATIEPNNASDKTVIWSSSNPSIADVNSSGLVTGYAVGNVQITATSFDGSYTATCDVTVKKSLQEIMDSITSITVSNPTNTNSQTKPRIPITFVVDGITVNVISTSRTQNFEVGTGIITRSNNTTRTITITLEGTDGLDTELKIFNVYIPSNNTSPASSRTITVTPQ